MPRSKPSQIKHDKMVRHLAKEYEERGYKVKADVKGYDRPETVKGLRPDLRANKSGHETVVEVETKDSADSSRDHEQQETFKDWSKNSVRKHYKRIIT